MKNKSEILALYEETLAASLQNGTMDESSLRGEEAFNRKMVAYIDDQLGDGSYLTCEDFGYTGRQCCPVCHEEYPDEMCIERLPDGRKAWICCAIRRAVYHNPQNAPDLFEKMLVGASPEIERGLER